MKKIDLTMEFRIADTFTDSLARLTGEEQKAVKTTAFDLQINPSTLNGEQHENPFTIYRTLYFGDRRVHCGLCAARRCQLM